MAVPRIPSAPETWRRPRVNDGDCHRRRLIAATQVYSDLHHIMLGPLPSDMAAEECSIITLFRASRALNLLTGGSADMTFSARCHVRRTGALRFWARAAWGVVEGTIDTICEVCRGECEHCATALDNHRARRRDI